MLDRDGGASSLQLEDGKYFGMKRNVKDNMVSSADGGSEGQSTSADLTLADDSSGSCELGRLAVPCIASVGIRRV
jgi:hypothetical protein